MRWDGQIYHHKAAIEVAVDVHAIQVAILPWENFRVIHPGVLNRKPACWVPFGKINSLTEPKVNVREDNPLATTQFIQIQLRLKALFILAPDDPDGQSCMFGDTTCPFCFQMAIRWGDDGCGDHSTNFTLLTHVCKALCLYIRFRYRSNQQRFPISALIRHDSSVPPGPRPGHKRAVRCAIRAIARCNHVLILLGDGGGKISTISRRNKPFTDC